MVGSCLIWSNKFWYDFLNLCGFASKIISADGAQDQENEQLVLKTTKLELQINKKISAIIMNWELEPVFATQFK